MCGMEPETGVVRLPGGETVSFLLYRSGKRFKSISLRIRDDGTLAVRAPVRTAKKELLDVLARRAAWITRAQSLVADNRARRVPGSHSFVPYLGNHVPLVGGFPPLPVPGTWDTGGSDEMTLLERQRGLEEWYLAAGRLELPPWVNRLAPVVGSVPSRIVVSRQRAAWGSCARDGTIRLSWRLMMLRPALVDAVIVHELCHLIQHNHSPAFWREVERVSPDYRSLRAELRAAQRALPF